jgi:hypothetical protein
MGSSVQEKKMHYPVMTEKQVADHWQVSLKTLLGIKREFKPEVPEAAQGPDAKAEDNYFTAKEIAEAASLPIDLGQASKMSRLAQLAPDLIEAIVLGRLEVGISQLLRGKLSASWLAQREALVAGSR